MKDITIKTGKSWHTEDQKLVLQVHCSTPSTVSLDKKFYLVCDSSQINKGFSFAKTKPENIKNQGMAANMLRKYLPSAILYDLIQDTLSGDYWAILKRDQIFYIRIEHSSPPQLSFIDANRTVLFRISNRGAYTKRQEFNGELPEANCNNFLSILSSTLEFYITKQAEDKEGRATPPQIKAPGFSFQREAKNRLARRIKTVKKSIQKLKSSIPDNNKISEQDLKSRLLQQYSYLIKEGMYELKISPAMSGKDKEIVITLDSETSAGKIVDDAFVKLKKIQKAALIGKKQLELNEKNLHNMCEDLHKLREHDLSVEEIETILNRYKLANFESSKKRGKSERTALTTKNNQSSRPYKAYISHDGSLILVGKSSTDNDELTKKAKSNDYWLHSLGVTGSHVIIPFKNLKSQVLSPKTKKEAAILALHFSKRRSDYGGEVQICRKQHLKKKKGFPPGKWLVEKSETFYISYTEEDAKTVLERLVR
ncbi:MAG: NFACT RNA binding domain-containing protein [Bdellovibrionota bacterium]